MAFIKLVIALTQLLPSVTAAHRALHYGARPGRRLALARGAQLRKVTQDPDDNIFLECADVARADYLVTGNQKHFPRFWKKTKIITPREFISLTAPHLTK
jgi:predicted nucleic acid-binding protein